MISNTVRIAVDLDGGDNGFMSVIKGIELAVKLGFVNPSEVVAIGSDKAVGAAQKRLRKLDSFVVCSEAIDMGEEPMVAKRKRDSSMARGLKGVRDQNFQAFVTAGNTAALVYLSNGYLGRLGNSTAKVIPGIAAPLPNLHGACLLLDAGAMKDDEEKISPQALSFYAQMGSVYAECVWGIEKPIVCLLNQGKEETKGDNTLRQAFAEISKVSWLNFKGNIEADRIPNDPVNVVVCSGKVGNIYIKAGEGFRNYQAAKLGLLWDVVSFFNAHRKHEDYKEIGGAIILGFNGIVIKAHGKSDAMAIANAIRRAYLEAKFDIVNVIKQRLMSTD